MNVEKLIKQSTWWREAERTPDRHYDASSGVTLADHLLRVRGNVHLLLSPEGLDGYFAELREALAAAGCDLEATLEILSTVALLHDIGKTSEHRDAECEHPLTHKRVKMRHPVVSLLAALETLPDDQPSREAVLALVEEHDTPYSWYMQFQRSGQIPRRKAWARLDRAIDPREDGTGLILLCVFKLADIDGHDDVADVPWFIEDANASLLREKGKWVPVPDRESLRRLAQQVS
jgi:hypothetical protein